MLKSLQVAMTLSWTGDAAALLSGPDPHLLTLRVEAPPVRDGSGYGPGHLPITPVPDSYRCRDELFRIAFEEGVAYVTLPDNTLTSLPRDRVSGRLDPEAPRLLPT